jgi:hypothetical protein
MMFFTSYHGIIHKSISVESHSNSNHSGSATVNPHQIQFYRSLLAKASIIESTKIRVCSHVYSDSDD